MNNTMNMNGMGFVENKEATAPVSQPPKEEVVPSEPVVEEPKEKEKTAEELAQEFANMTNTEKNDNLFSSIDFGPLKKYLDDDNITDISYSNNGQLWLKSLDKGVYRASEQEVNDALVEKIAFQCSNVMGKTFNMAHPFLDSESAELRMNFVHDSIARNGIAAVFRKTPAKIRLEKEKLLNEKYVTLNIHDFLIRAVQGHCNIIVAGETGSGKTELVKYLASHTAENEKIITIEDTLELHLDRIYPNRDIVAMKTNNIASYSDVLVTCMRQNPKWILLSEVRSAEAVTAVRNSISSGHNILSTIHADKAESIPHRLYSLLESNIDVDQFLKTIYRYVQLGIYVRGRYDPAQKRFVREIGEVTEFYVDDDNVACHNVIYRKTVKGAETYHNPSEHLRSYLEGQGVDISDLHFADDENENSVISDSATPQPKEKVEAVPAVEPPKPVAPVAPVAPAPVQQAPVPMAPTPQVPVQPVQPTQGVPVQPMATPTPVVQTPVAQVQGTPATPAAKPSVEIEVLDLSTPAEPLNPLNSGVPSTPMVAVPSPTSVGGPMPQPMVQPNMPMPGNSMIPPTQPVVNAPIGQ